MKRIIITTILLFSLVKRNYSFFFSFFLSLLPFFPPSALEITAKSLLKNPPKEETITKYKKILEKLFCSKNAYISVLLEAIGEIYVFEGVFKSQKAELYDYFLVFFFCYFFYFSFQFVFFFDFFLIEPLSFFFFLGKIFINCLELYENDQNLPPLSHF